MFIINIDYKYSHLISLIILNQTIHNRKYILKF